MHAGYADVAAGDRHITNVIEHIQRGPQWKDTVVSACDGRRDQRGAVDTLIAAFEGSNKPFLHTSGSGIVGDASGGEASENLHGRQFARTDRR